MPSTYLSKDSRKPVPSNATEKSRPKASKSPPKPSPNVSIPRKPVGGSKKAAPTVTNVQSKRNSNLASLKPSNRSLPRVQKSPSTATVQEDDTTKKLENQNVQLKQRITELESILKASKDDKDSLGEEYRTENLKLKEKIEEFKLKLQLADLGKDDESNVKQQLAECQKTCKTCKAQSAELERLADLNKTQEDSLRELKLQHDRYRDMSEEQEAQLATLNAQVRRLTSANEADKTRHKEALVEKEKQITGHKKRIDTMALKIIESEKKVKGLTDKADRAIKLETQLTAAKKQVGELTEKVNVKIPSLEQENRKLRRELAAARAPKKDSANEARSTASKGSILSSTDSTEALKAENLDLREKLEIAEAERDAVVAEEQVGITLEKNNQSLHAKYAAAVKEFDDKDSQISHWKKIAQGLERKVQKQLQTIETLEQAPQLPDEDMDCGSAVTSVGSPIYPPKLIVYNGINVDPISIPKPLYVHTETPPKPDMAFTSFQPSFLLNDINITININPNHKVKWARLKQIQAAVTKKSGIDIQGPIEYVKELARAMDDLEKEHAAKTAKISELRKLMWGQAHEIDRLKKVAEKLESGRREPSCSIVAHRGMKDELEAMGTRLDMQDLLLASWGRKQREG